MQYNSSYLIDSNKKCVIPRGGKSPDTGLYWTAYGDVKSEALQNFGYSYKEDFVKASDVLEDDFEKIVSPLTGLIEAATSKLPFLKGANLNNPKKLRETAMFLYSIWDSFKEGVDNVTDASDLARLFEKPYLYNLPLRKAAPALTFEGGSVEIEFAYGKCNMYNAYKEVYEPLMNIHKNLFPAITPDPNYKGLGNLSYTYNIPYQQQSFVEMLKTMMGAANQNIKKVTVGKGSDKGYLDVLPSLKKLSESLEGKDDPFAKLNVQDLKVKTSWENENKDKNKVAESLAAAVEEVYTNGTKEDAQRSAIEDLSYLGEGDNAKDTAIDFIKDTYWDKKAENNKADIKIPSQLLKLKNNKNGQWKMTIGGTSASDKKDNDNTKNILESLVNLQLIATGATMDRIADKLLDKQTDEIRIGYTPVYVTSLQDLAGLLDDESKTCIDPKVKLKSLLFAKVTIKFNFANTDENGWPMSGSLKIEDIWNLRYPNATLEFNNDTSEDGMYSEKSINYNNDDEESENN